MSRDAGPVKGGNTVIAFVDDPTGYKWELITRPEPIPEPIAQVPIKPILGESPTISTIHTNKCALLREGTVDIRRPIQSRCSPWLVA